jgi:hypothetical protein
VLVCPLYYYQLQYLPDGGNQWCLSNIALDLLYWEMYAVSYQCTAVAIKMASKVGTFFVVVWFDIAVAATGVIWSK